VTPQTVIASEREATQLMGVIWPHDRGSPIDLFGFLEAA
jgi:hypothetical protein